MVVDKNKKSSLVTDIAIYKRIHQEERIWGVGETAGAEGKTRDDAENKGQSNSNDNWSTWKL